MICCRAWANLDAASTLVMCGDQDKPRPPSEAREMAELIGCPCVLVPEAGHISNLENPGFVTQTLLAFLAEQNISRMYRRHREQARSHSGMQSPCRSGLAREGVSPITLQLKETSLRPKNLRQFVRRRRTLLLLQLALVVHVENRRRRLQLQVFHQLHVGRRVSPEPPAALSFKALSELSLPAFS